MTVKGSDRDPEKVCNTDGCDAWKMGDFQYCRNHKGVSDDGESHTNNGNAAKHNLTSDPLKYKERQPQTEEDWIRSVRESILDRMRHNGLEPDFLDQVLAERVASQLHIAIHATDYVDDEGLVQTVFVEDGGYEKDIPNGLVKELRQYDDSIFKNLKKLGVLNDPDSQKADAQKNLQELWADDLSN